MKLKPDKPSDTAWAIVGTDGRVRMEQRGFHNDGQVWSCGGASSSLEDERLMKFQDKVVRSGPLWRRKRDAKILCWPGERVVRVRLVEVNDAK